MDRDTFRELLEKKQYRVLREELLKLDPLDIAVLLEDLPSEEDFAAFRLLPKDVAVKVFDLLDVKSQYSLLESFKGPRAAAILEAMEPDDRAELLEEVPAVVARQLLRLLSPQERDITLKLLGYEDDTAGRIMNPDFVDLRHEMTVAQALNRVRQLAVERETIYELYVIDYERRLLGTVSLKDLVVSKPANKIADVMQTDFKIVHTHTNQEEVAKLLRVNDLSAIPVVDNEGRLVGVVTLDDVIDIIEEEATEDI